MTDEQNVDFENGIDDLILETFDTLKELKAAILYFGHTTLADLLEAHISTYAEMEENEK